jgi:hypothetical protein
MSKSKVISVRFEESVLLDIKKILNHKTEKYPYMLWETRADLIKYFVLNGINRYKRNNNLEEK